MKKNKRQRARKREEQGITQKQYMRENEQEINDREGTKRNDCGRSKHKYILERKMKKQQCPNEEDRIRKNERWRTNMKECKRTNE